MSRFAATKKHQQVQGIVLIVLSWDCHFVFGGFYSVGADRDPPPLHTMTQRQDYTSFRL